MELLRVHEWATLSLFALGAISLVALIFISAPYGRHARKGWGPTVGNRLGWIVMESPAVLVFVALFLLGARSDELVPRLLCGLWLFHYIYRTFLFPFRLRTTDKRMPVVIALMAIVFNTLNAFINASWVGALGSYPASWLSQPCFVGGTLLFFVGWSIHVHADGTLIALRKPGEKGYKIPRGGLYEWVSCPNYLGEILQWTGWTIATWSLPGLAFAFFTCCNLVPRALKHHQWYQETFKQYPKSRKALVPLLF